MSVFAFQQVINFSNDLSGGGTTKGERRMQRLFERKGGFRRREKKETINISRGRRNCVSFTRKRGELSKFEGKKGDLNSCSIPLCMYI